MEPREEIRAELVASVLEVSATAGVRVAGGQAIVLLESMKMEIPVVSETGGPSCRSPSPWATSSRAAT